MFENTRSVIGDTLNTAKKIARITDIVAQILYIVYLIVAVVLGSGMLITNGVLLLVSMVYFTYYLITMREWYTKDEKLNRAKTKKVCKIIKRIVNAIVIIIAIIDLIIYPINVVSLLITVLMIVGFVASLVLELLVVSYIERRKELIIGAAKRDLLNIVKPLGLVTSLFNHETVEEKKEKIILEKELDLICGAQKAKRKEKALWRREVARKRKEEKWLKRKNLKKRQSRKKVVEKY